MKERKVGGLAARTIMRNLATGMSKKELSRLGNILAGLRDEGPDNDMLVERSGFGSPCCSLF